MFHFSRQSPTTVLRGMKVFRKVPWYDHDCLLDGDMVPEAEVDAVSPARGPAASISRQCAAPLVLPSLPLCLRAHKDGCGRAGRKGRPGDACNLAHPGACQQGGFAGPETPAQFLPSLTGHPDYGAARALPSQQSPLPCCRAPRGTRSPVLEARGLCCSSSRPVCQRTSHDRIAQQTGRGSGTEAVRSRPTPVPSSFSSTTVFASFAE